MSIVTFIKPIKQLTGKLFYRGKFYVQRRGEKSCTVFIPEWTHQPTEAQKAAQERVREANKKVHHILHTPALRAEYERRFAEDKSAGRTTKHRLCDYVFSQVYHRDAEQKGE